MESKSEGLGLGLEEHSCPGNKEAGGMDGYRDVSEPVHLTLGTPTVSYPEGFLFCLQSRK